MSCLASPFVALPFISRCLNAFQQSIVGFVKFTDMQAGCADVYCGDQHRFHTFRNSDVVSCVFCHHITPHQGENNEL